MKIEGIEEIEERLRRLRGIEEIEERLRRLRRD
jgi:hypothetical protein